ncbi:MAG: DNA/RNA non-specific endonuclease [Bacteroidia bacterium]|nr:DNA/RNA non-specific endonuclease [Bacteroidia bacterium]
MMKYTSQRTLLLAFVLAFWAFGRLGAQNFPAKVGQLEAEIAKLKERETEINSEIETIKLDFYSGLLKSKGLPALKTGEEVIHHKMFSLVYAEKHEQAKWVAHLIPPEVMEGKEGRTNDFRPDPLIKTGSAVEEDYFLKKELPDGSFEYDGFGYDRGHLAPSADFRWSGVALSESYFYSNMSPQNPDFNRGIWADLEARVRGYIYRNPQSILYVVTGPLLNEELNHIERGMNKVSIPKAYFKVVADLSQGKAIAFVLPNEPSAQLLSSFAKSIDEVETLTGIDFFADLEDGLESKLESQKVVEDWLPEAASGNVEPILATSLPRNHFNTLQAKAYMDKNDAVFVCGKVVGGRTSRAGNILLNLDRAYPDQIFTVFIRKENIVNFSYDPEKELEGQVICVKGKVANMGGTPAMYIENEKQLTLYNEE